MRLSFLFTLIISAYYLNAQPSEGLIAYYKFDNNAVDSGPNNFDGSVMGASSDADPQK